MTWLIILILLTFCFTVGLTARYRELIVELKEQRLQDEKDFHVELMELLRENSELQFKLNQLEGVNYGQS